MDFGIFHAQIRKKIHSTDSYSTVVSVLIDHCDQVTPVMCEQVAFFQYANIGQMAETIGALAGFPC